MRTKKKKTSLVRQRSRNLLVHGCERDKRFFFLNVNWTSIRIYIYIRRRIEVENCVHLIAFHGGSGTFSSSLFYSADLESYIAISFSWTDCLTCTRRSCSDTRVSLRHAHIGVNLNRRIYRRLLHTSFILVRFVHPLLFSLLFRFSIPFIPCPRLFFSSTAFQFYLFAFFF